MGRPKISGKRPGGRNAQFFEGLSGLARGLNAVIEENATGAGATTAAPCKDDRLREAEERRRKRNEKRLRAAGHGNIVRQAEPHVFYTADDPDCPDSVKNAWGDVDLALCRVCGQAEGDLTKFCPGAP